MEKNVIKFAWHLLGLAIVSFTQYAAGLEADSAGRALVDQRVEYLKASGAEDDSEPLKTYATARDLFRRVETLQRERIVYQDSMRSEPLREAEIQSRIDSLDDPYDPSDEIAGLSAAESSSRLLEVREELRELQSHMADLDRSLGNREGIRADLRQHLVAARRQLDALTPTAGPPDTGAGPSLAEAQAWRNLAEAQALRAEIQATEAQLESLPVRFSAMAAERAELTLISQRQASLISLLEARLRASTRASVAPLATEIDASDPSFPIAQALANETDTLRRRQEQISDRLAELDRRRDEVRRLTSELEERYAVARRIVDFAADSEELGAVLLKHWEQIDQLSPVDQSRRLSSEAGNAVISRIDHEQLLSTLLNAGSHVDAQLIGAGLETGSVSDATREQLITLTRGLREQLRSTIELESRYIEALAELDDGLQELQTLGRSYRDFLEGLILWVPNRPVLWTLSRSSVDDNLQGIVGNLGRLEPRIGVIPALLIAVGILLILYHRYPLATSRDEPRAAHRPPAPDLGSTLRSVVVCARRALPLPMVFVGFGVAFSSSTAALDRGIGELLFLFALALYTFDLMRIVCEPRGPAVTDFGWSADTTTYLHTELGDAVHWWLPAVAGASLVNRLTPPADSEPLARILMLIALILIGYQTGRRQYREISAQGRAWFRDSRNRLRLTLLLIIGVLLAAAINGQVHALAVITTCLIASACVGVGLLIVRALLTIWLKVTETRLRRQASGVGSDLETDTTASSDLATITNETQQLLNTLMATAALVAAVIIWSPLLPAFREFARITLWSSSTIVNEETVITHITLATLLTVVVLASLTVLAARHLPALVEIVLRSQTSVSASARYATSTVLNYAIIGFGIIAGLSALGLQWSQLQWLVAALGVGIGFGLQEIVANFISGIIILFERPIRVGDVVTVGDKDGRVTRIRIRATTLRDWDGKELVVPNKEFITGRLLNWTLSDSQIRIVIPVGITYGSDVEKALVILTDLINEHPNTLDDPAPLIVFERFGDNALELSARCFVDLLENRWMVVTELHSQINRAFRDAGIVIAFPQRDVHLDIDGPIRVTLDEPSPPDR